MPLVVDASLVLLWLLRQEHSLQADALRERWQQEQPELMAPPLLPAEVPSVLRGAVYRHRLTQEEGDAALRLFQEIGISIRQPPDLLPRAWELGKALNAPRLYDLYYLALARIEGCPLWTADRRFYRLASAALPDIHWVGEASDDL